MSASHEFIVVDALIAVARLTAFAGLILLGPTVTALLVVSQSPGTWRHWYVRSLVAGAIIGSPVGALVALAMGAAAGGLPEPWRLTFIPLCAIVGGAVVIGIFAITVALVQAVSRFSAGRPAEASANAADRSV